MAAWITPGVDTHMDKHPPRAPFSGSTHPKSVDSSTTGVFRIGRSPGALAFGVREGEEYALLEEEKERCERCERQGGVNNGPVPTTGDSSSVSGEQRALT